MKFFDYKYKLTTTNRILFEGNMVKYFFHLIFKIYSIILTIYKNHYLQLIYIYINKNFYSI